MVWKFSFGVSGTKSNTTIKKVVKRKNNAREVKARANVVVAQTIDSCTVVSTDYTE